MHAEFTARETNAGNRSVSVQRRYLSERELAQYSGIGIRTLQRWRLFGQGPAYKKFGGMVRYDLPAFDTWAAAQPGGGGPA
jgi:predicted DNA-binding transcriptional regulator AlpA